MATMALSLPQFREFEVAERKADEKITRLEAGLTFSEAMFTLCKAAFRLVLVTKALDTAVKVQGDLIGLLEHPALNNLGEASLLKIAEKTESLVSKNSVVFERTRDFPLPLWDSYLNQLEQQAEKLDSIAESFRMAADNKSREYIHTLITSAETESKATNKHDWREFVASLHD